MTTSNNYCIILAGGVGCRLWPYSRQQRPKQFLDLFGMGLSMLQITYRRFAKLLPPENIYVSTSAEYVNMVREQLADLPAENVVAEPVQLGTAPATALAAAYINGLHPKANLIISPADQIILREDEFQQQVMQGFRFVEETPNFLCLGVRAERPETNYGYIQAGEVECGVSWSWNVLNYRDSTPNYKFTLAIPSDGSVMTGYASVISKNSDTPCAAALAREYIFSDAGQINLAKSGALPTRTDVVVPDEYKAFDPSTYANAVSSFSDAEAYSNACLEVSEWWNENIIPLLN